jgi:hypothetical protein
MPNSPMEMAVAKRASLALPTHDASVDADQPWLEN